MQVINFEGEHAKKVVALGFFDSLHIGHRYIIGKAKEYAKEMGMGIYVFTFSNNPYAELGSDNTLLYSFEQRISILRQLGVDGVLHLPLDKNMAAEDFARALSMHGTTSVFYGSDYKFGHLKSGNAEHFAALGMSVCCCDFLLHDGVKVSTRHIRELLERAEVEYAAILLGDSYHIGGIVEGGYKIGRTLGFPTANLSFRQGSLPLLPGVYLVYVIIDGERFEGISNVGARPTYADADYKVETYLDNFSRDIYGKYIEIYFSKYIRESKKFENGQQLAAQLEEDKKWIK